MAVDLATIRKRLKFRSWHRGTREMDLLLGQFADWAVDQYDLANLDRYGALLEESDPDIYDWVIGRGAPENESHGPILGDLIAFHTLRDAGKS